ncbi:MAG: hypothetical protein WBA77_17005 [Microcoleaceae cyanobacterium]
MKKLYSRLLTASIVCLSYGLISPNSAEAVTFDLSWTGQTAGYSANGSFSYDETQNYADGIVRKQDLESFDISFFDPDGNLIQAFADNHLILPEFNFNFNTSNNTIFQEGVWNEADGLNVGGIRGEELNFWSAPNPKVDLFPDGEPSPHVHLTDWGSEFPDLPIGFTGRRSHLDIAFFTRTAAEVLNDPTAGDALGEKLIATKVPEPNLTLALVGLGIIGIKFRKQYQ